ncbi:MAG: outer membrane protein assembly factor BamD [Ignavibacteriaceae bacterium]
MKKLFFLAITSLFFWGCSSSIDTIDLSPEERLNYAMGLYNNEDYLEAVNEFQAIILQFPGNAIADDAQYYLGMTRFNREEFVMSAYEFSKLIKNMPASNFVSEAQYMLAESYYRLSPNFALDQRYSRKAIEEYQAFIDFFPTNTRVQEAEAKIVELNEKLAHKEYNTAYIYGKLEYFTAALNYYDNVINTYHDTRFAPMAMYDKIMLLTSRNRNTEALAEIEVFTQRYPDNYRAIELQQLKSSLENKLSAIR